jgi:hypothetical protein
MPAGREKPVYAPYVTAGIFWLKNRELARLMLSRF